MERFNSEPQLLDALSQRGVQATIVRDTDHLSTILATHQVMQAIDSALA
jgi:hypothetical protein